MRYVIGTTMSLIGWIGWILCGFGGLLICLRIVHSVLGIGGLAAGVLLGPITFALTPVYALVVLDTWMPILVCYLGGFVSTALIGLGAAVRM